jgi:uncharacterized delta-60 repeat protein
MQGLGNDGEVETKMKVANRAILNQSDGKIVVGGQAPGKIATIERYNEDGSADASLNGTGKIQLSTIPNSIVLAMSRQPDGKLLLTGNTNTDLFVARINDDGSLDTGFGSDGLITVNAGATEAGQAITTLADGRIMVSGHSETEEESSMLLWAFLPDGTSDNQFGSGGMVTLFEGAANNFSWNVFPDGDTAVIVIGSAFNGADTEPVMFRVMNDGSLDGNFGINGAGGKSFPCGQSLSLSGIKAGDNIFICGTSFNDGSNQLAVSKFLPDGIIDSTFAANGSLYASVVHVDFPDASYSSVFYAGDLPNGKTLVVGDGPFRAIYCAVLNDNGTPDSSYGGDGIHVFQNLSKFSTYAKVSDDDSIVYITEFFESYYAKDFEDFEFTEIEGIAVHKIRANGLPDSSFAINGIGYYLLDDPEILDVQSTAIQPDGKLLVTGKSTEGIYLIRFTETGEIDSSFSTNGIKIIEEFSQLDYSMLEVRSDGNIVLVAFLEGTDFETSYRRVYRLLPDGMIDSTYGTNGFVEAKIGFASAGESILQPDNKLLMLIEWSSENESIFRLNEDGSTDLDFGIAGELHIVDDQINALASFTLQPDGKIVSSRKINSLGLSIERYYSDGVADSSFGVDGSLIISDYGSGSLSMLEDGKILVWNVTEEFIARVNNDFQSSVEEVENEKAVTIYPNPVINNLFIHFEDATSNENLLNVADVSGRICLHKLIGKGEQNTVIDVSSLASGYYLLNCQSNTEIISIPFIK